MSDDRPPQALVVREEAQLIEDTSAAQKALDIMSKGDLSKLTIPERAEFLKNMALSLGLNPLTRPVDLIPNDKGQLIVYWNKGATDQLRKKHHVNLEILEHFNPTPNTYAVRVRATMPSGRQDEDLGVVVMTPGMDPMSQANALMRCPTKGKRRVTLSILGLGGTDESETDTFPLFKQQIELANQPRTLSAPSHTAVVVQPRQEVQEAEIVPPAASQEPTAAPATQAQVKPQAQAAAVAKPAATVMPGRRLPVAPPVVIKP